MTQWVDYLKEHNIPSYAKDAKLNLDAVIKNSSLDVEQAEVIALVASFASGNKALWEFIYSHISNKAEADAGLVAGSIMAQNNVWYPYVEMAGDEALKGLPAQLRMNGIVNSGGTTKAKFEAYSLSASIVGKCHFCVKAHYDNLKKEGYSTEQLRDIGRISAVMVSIAKVFIQ